MITLTVGKGTSAMLQIPTEAKRLAVGFNAAYHLPDGSDVRVQGGIIDAIGDTPLRLTPAQRSNLLPGTAQIYEDSWRSRSIGILSGKDHPLSEETARLVEWLDPRPGERILDLGCSTCVYARALALAEPGAEVVAIDMARPMLEQARRRAVAEKADLYLLRADVEHLPFATASIRKAAIGGSLNEFRDPVKALYEARRVLDQDGRLFVMALLRAESLAGNLLQKAAETGGISFWTRAELDTLYDRTGFGVRRRHTHGIVDFALLG